MQQERQRVVALEADGATVRKTFIGAHPEPLLALATREHDRLSRFSSALSAVDGATCPKPLELRGGAHPSVAMTRGEGVVLSERLRYPMDEGEVAWLLRVLTRALTVYVVTFSEPYYDFHFRNMLYDGPRRQVTFLDFGVPDHLVPARSILDQHPPVDASLGNLYGSSLFEGVRPRNLRRIRQNRRLLSAAVRVVGSLLDQAATLPVGIVPTQSGIRKATETVFAHSVSWGPGSHRLWYRLFPRHLARGVQRLDEAFTTAPLGRGDPASHRAAQ